MSKTMELRIGALTLVAGDRFPGGSSLPEVMIQSGQQAIYVPLATVRELIAGLELFDKLTGTGAATRTSPGR